MYVLTRMLDKTHFEPFLQQRWRVLFACFVVLILLLLVVQVSVRVDYVANHTKITRFDYRTINYAKISHTMKQENYEADIVDSHFSNNDKMDTGYETKFSERIKAKNGSEFEILFGDYEHTDTDYDPIAQATRNFNMDDNQMVPEVKTGSLGELQKFENQAETDKNWTELLQVQNLSEKIANISLGGILTRIKKKERMLQRITKAYHLFRKTKGFQLEGNFRSIETPDVKQCSNRTQRPLTQNLNFINEQWQLLEGLPHDTFVHDREEFLGNNSADIRIYIVISGLNFVGRPQCLVWYRGARDPVSISVSSIERLSTSRRHFVNNITYSQYLLTCGLPKDGIYVKSKPEVMSLVLHPCENPTNLLPVTYPYPATSTSSQTDFGVCVVGQWGNIGDNEAPFLAEWIELNRMFGVSEINMYNVSLQPSKLTEKVFAHYRREGILKVIHQTSPVTLLSHDDEYDASQLCLRSSINDCLLRNRNKFKYIIVIDRDEVIVPRIHSNYNELIKHLHNNYESFDSAADMIFQSSSFYMDLKPDQKQPPYLATQRYLQAQPPDSLHVTNFVPMKSFVSTQFCRSVWNHNCQIPFHNKTIVPAQIAVMHHYRRSCTVASRADDWKYRYGECRWIHHRQYKDTFMLRHQDELKRRVDETFALLGVTTAELIKLSIGDVNRKETGMNDREIS